MKAKFPTFGAYAIAYNLINSNYPWKECIRNALTFCNEFYILECNSSDETYQEIYKEFSNEPNIILKRSEYEWDMNDKTIVGCRKQEARKMVQTDYCVYLDFDEILQVKDRGTLFDMILNNPTADVFALPYFTFFGTPHQIANFKDAENFWRWKIFRNLPHIGHGIHGAARKYDEDGKLYMDKTISDGCEIININTLELMPALMFMPPHYIQAGNLYRQTPSTMQEKSLIKTMFSECLNEFPIVCWHYGWVNFEEKAKNALAYWTKTKAFKDGDEHSGLFDKLTTDTEEKIKEWESIDTISLNIREHPQIIKSKITPQLKPKILNICQDGAGMGGVAKWGRSLTEALNQYDVQTFSFNEYVSNAPQNSSEIDKARSFTNWVRNHHYDDEALVLFGDGFWAATYNGPAKVVSVVHGLWTHPLREKYGDDGLLKERTALWEYQLSYFKQAKGLGHTLLSISPLVHKLLKEDFNIDSILIPNAIDLDFYDNIRVGSIDKDKPLILHGIKTNHKGLDILPLVENHPLIKDRFDIGTVDEIAKAGDCDKTVTFKAADVAFLPSKWEASSYLLLECLANNLPIVALRAGILHCPELKHLDKIGIILDEYDADKFAEALVEVSENAHNYKNGRMFLQENNMTKKHWDTEMKKLIYKVI